MRDEKHKLQAHAVNLLLQIVEYLETMGLELGIRRIAASAELLAAVLKPNRPGTCLRHCRMFNRLRMFIEATPSAKQPPLAMDSTLKSQWLSDLADHNVGRYTLRAALGCVGYLGALLEFPVEETPRSLEQHAENYCKEDWTPELQRRHSPCSIFDASVFFDGRT